MLISIYNEDLDRWEIKEFDTLTTEEKIYYAQNEYSVAEFKEPVISEKDLTDKIIEYINTPPHIIETPVISDEERRKYGDRIMKVFSDSPHDFQLKENSVPRETYKFSKELLDQRYTSININAALHALDRGQNPYTLIEQLLQQLDNVQKEYTKLLMHVGSLER